MAQQGVQAANGARWKLEDFTIDGEIAKGSFGVVYKLVRKADKRVFALKQVKLAGMKRVDRQEAIDEARMLAQLNHPYITLHYESFIDKDDKLNIIMEYASKGNVSALLKAQRGKGLPEDTVWKILIQSLLGLQHMHSKKIIHRDIKALNLFIDYQDNIKIGDLGIARALSDGSAFAHTIVGTPYYLSPELCEDKPYNEKSDIWALGVVMYECCMNRYPFDAQNEGALIRKILRGQYTPISGPYTAAMLAVVTIMMAFKPSERPDANTLLRHPAVIQKAKALGIDLNPKPHSGVEDQPVYQHDIPAQATHSQPAGAVPARHDAVWNRGEVPEYEYTPGGGVAVRGARQAGAPAAAAAGPHIFDPPQGYGQPLHAGSPGVRGHGGAPQPGQSPARGGVGAGGNAQYDAMADEIQRLALGTVEFNRQNADRLLTLQAQGPSPPNPHHPGQRDNMKAVIGHPSAPTPPNQRVRPEALPPAGAVPRSDRPGSSPFALHYTDVAAQQQTMAQLQSSAVWGAQYAAPQYGRKRCPDLQITGPSLRGGQGARPGSAHTHGYTPAHDDATSYVSSSYATYYK